MPKFLHALTAQLLIILSRSAVVAFAPFHGAVARSVSKQATSPIRFHAESGHFRAGTRLAAALDPGTGGASINRGLVRQLVLNQALVGFSIWNGGLGAQVLARDARFDAGPEVLLLGVAGFLPLFLLSRAVETSESGLVAGLNLSTNMFTMRLFGAEKKPFKALIVSAALAGITGLVEETIFRGELLPTFEQWARINWGSDSGVLSGAVLSTLLFAALHVNPLGLLKGADAALDSLVLFSFQICTGATFATIYLLTGNLAIPVVAHALYDFYTFYATHLEVSTQMDYARTEALLPGSGRNNKIEKKWRESRGDDFIEETKQSFYLMDTNRDGVLSRKELRIALYSYGVKLSEEESGVVAGVADTDSSGEIDFDKFLEFVGPEGSTDKAAKQSLLGMS